MHRAVRQARCEIERGPTVHASTAQDLVECVELTDEQLDIMHEEHTKLCDEMADILAEQHAVKQELAARLESLADQAEDYIDYGWDHHNESYPLQVEIDEAENLLNE